MNHEGVYFFGGQIASTIHSFKQIEAVFTTKQPFLSFVLTEFSSTPNADHI